MDTTFVKRFGIGVVIAMLIAFSVTSSGRLDLKAESSMKKVYILNQ